MTVRIKTIRQGDADWYINDGIKMAPRASVELSAMISLSDSLVIQRALANGYLKPVAYMREDEYMWEKLSG
jgi:hypothetical protein